MIYEYKGFRPKIAKTAYVSESATIIGNVNIGEYCFIGPGAVIRCDAEKNAVNIGDCSVIEDGVLIHLGSLGARCDIGKHVTVGHGAIVHGRLLSDYANVGMGAVLSLDSVVGKYSVVAEGAVVKQGQQIPERVVVGGAPARVLRELQEKDIALWTLSNEYYVDLTNAYNTPGVLVPVDRELCE